MSKIDFSNTRIAFESKSDKELRSMEFLFRMMSKSGLSSLASGIGLKAVQWNVPLARWMVEKTIFKQFCGGKTLEETIPAIEALEKYRVLTVLDYGSEGREEEHEFEKTKNQTLKSIEFASSYNAVPVVSSKVTGLARTELLKKYQRAREELTAGEQNEFASVEARLDEICKLGKDKGVAVMIDAEETTIQETIDELVEKMMEKYNREQVVVYQTFQLYRKDKLAYLKRLHQESLEKGYFLGAKLVRGAYMEKERKWAKEGGYPSLIHDTKQDTDRDYNLAVLYCVDNYRDIALCNASHNVESAKIMVDRIDSIGAPKDHPRLNFCQLYGMSDYITYNLASAGYNVAKYVPYGPVEEVIPYLIRRAEENASVTGEMSREYKMILQEWERRRDN